MMKEWYITNNTYNKGPLNTPNLLDMIRRTWLSQFKIKRLCLALDSQKINGENFGFTTPCRPSGRCPWAVLGWIVFGRPVDCSALVFGTFFFGGWWWWWWWWISWIEFDDERWKMMMMMMMMMMVNTRGADLWKERTGIGIKDGMHMIEILFNQLS